MATTIAGSYLESLFDLVTKIYTKHGTEVYVGWKVLSSLNEYYPAHMAGNFIKTDENNLFLGFVSHHGSHRLFSGRTIGNDQAALEELTEVLGLVLADDIDSASSMTYAGHRTRYWRITRGEFKGDSAPEPSDEEPDVTKFLNFVLRLGERVKKETFPL